MSSLFTPMVSRNSSRRDVVGDVGLEGRVAAHVLGDEVVVDVDHALVRGGVDAHEDALAGPAARHAHGALVPDPADVVADGPIGEEVVVARRHGPSSGVSSGLGGGGVMGFCEHSQWRRRWRGRQRRNTEADGGDEHRGASRTRDGGLRDCGDDCI